MHMSGTANTAWGALKGRAFSFSLWRSSIVNRRSSVSGFTLLELLASIAILGILVVMISQIFGESDKAWNSGTGRSVNNTEGRAALNMIMRDLELAVADNVLTFKMGLDRTNLVTYGFTNSEINFVSLKNDSKDGNRTAREIQYWVNMDPAHTGRYQLVRSEVSDSLECYDNPRWYDQRVAGFSYAIVAENVVGLAFYAPDGSTTYDSLVTNQNTYVNSPPFTPRNTPPHVDVYLEIMNERESKQLNDLAGKGKKRDEDTLQCREFAERNARRYTGRAFFQNRQGYAIR
jgi:prepilin-type N-terminal cleavage/methylation domain-containing protein